jgi:hypothetical protein
MAISITFSSPHGGKEHSSRHEYANFIFTKMLAKTETWNLENVVNKYCEY